ncbi:Ferredoxin [Pseudobutyrivibrio sp. YE44]|uniref:Coenzyme F420 hydrogenase/dehydrogenase, beta subunit C-terminal domain n=1 Tax=Pseudobutyrivibrio sp. YE44 TaxID=1520802 RepID=UPI00088024B5|nr:Coenzyme F420 hydrogenase/dehydrogenase, beta subunit C-terminal domain [Pseudobutyrivibrio sp. YE44]SDB46813.1 Ferredoxin [Pseudobutyrivibrio sp. YE44]
MELLDENKCTGCTACYSACPVHAIEMKETKKGFFVPSIDSDKCINCKLCQKTCPEMNIEGINYNQPQHTYLAKNEDAIRMNSSSGGVFLSLAQEIIKREGTVYGAQYNSAIMVEHGRASDIKEAKKFCGSKYIQSNVGDAFSHVLDDLKSGKWVYFSGTACQVSGLINYLTKKNCNMDKLITQDFICHGVASPTFFADYKKALERKNRAKIVKFNFRGKPSPHKLQNIIVDFDNGKRFISASTSQDFFYHHFFKNLIIKPSCFNCKYANVKRVADITLGDCYHPINENINNDGYGISYFQVNTEKGLEFFGSIDTSNMELIETDCNKYIQPNMKAPSEKNPNYDAFWNEYETNGFKAAIKKYGNGSIKDEMKRIAAQIIYKLKTKGQVRQ